MVKNDLLKCSVVSLAVLAANGHASPAKPPNIVFILADDCAHTSLGCYGGENVKTPNIDRLASEGMRFTRAYTTMAMCVPFRAELYTGCYPTRTGCEWNHSATRPGTRSVPHYLKALGYRVGITGKEHFFPAKNFPFEIVPGFEKNCVAKKNYYEPEKIIPFLTRNPKQPFCLFVCSTNPHRPWTTGNPDHFDRAALKLPPALADTPVIRDDYARYLAEVEVLDQQVGDVLRILEEQGAMDNTVIMFSSEQGWQFPGGKWSCWDLGLHTALLARWPGHIQPGTTTDAMVQMCDVLPTMIDIAGGAAAKDMFDGWSFKPVLFGTEQKHRKLVFGMHNNVPEGPPYPIRTVRDEQFRYILNLTPQTPYVNKFINGEHRSPWFTSLEEAATNGNAHAARIVERSVHRPAVEMYRPDGDPFEMTNLAENPEYAKEKETLRRELEQWRKDQKDPGASVDTMEALQQNRTEFGWRQ